MAVVLGTNAVARDPDTAPAAAEIVIPTVGRPSLTTLLHALAAQEPPWPGRVIVVDDRADADPPLPDPTRSDLDVVIVRSGGRGPAAARNAGLADARAPWVVFLDDDVVPAPGWVAALHADLAATRSTTAAVRGRIVAAPEPDGAPSHAVTGPAPGAGADLAYRREALAGVGGFDERLAFPHLEHAEVGLRLRRTGGEVVPGTRTALHTTPPVGPWAAVARLRRHRDDARLRWEHGRDWRREAAVGGSRVRRHLVTTGAGLVAVAAAATGHRRAAALGGTLWLALTAKRVDPPELAGPYRPRGGVASVVLARAAVPPAAVYHRIRGELTVRKMAP